MSKNNNKKVKFEMIKNENQNTSNLQNQNLLFSSSKQSFESFIVEFKESRENVISIMKIVIDQQKSELFRQFINIKKKDNQNLMKEFMKSKYYEFVESIHNINETKIQVKGTDEVLNNLEESIQTFLSDFAKNYLDKIRKKENLMNLKQEKEKLNIAFILFAYLNKAKDTLKKFQFELTIRLISTASEKYLKRLPIGSSVFRRAESLITYLKNKITSTIEDKLTNWLVEIYREQNNIGHTLYKKLKSERERYFNVKSEFSFMQDLGKESLDSGNKLGKNIRNTKNIVDNLLLIRNTSNLNYMMNKNSLLKSSVLNQADILEEFDIINMVSNVNLNFLESAYSIYKKVDNCSKFTEHFLHFRQSQIQTLISLHDGKNLEKNNTNENNTNYTKNLPSNTMINYEIYFSDILGFIIIQIAVFELLPMFYTKRKFEDIMNYLLKELHTQISMQFDSLTKTEDFNSFQSSIFIFLQCIERIGVNERIGLDIKSSLVEMMKEKIKLLNFLLIRRYNNYFVNRLFEEKCVNIEVKNQDEFIKYCAQYSISLDDNSKPISGFIYPFKLPYTHFVIDVNESFKKYVEEIFKFVEPLFSEYENIMHETVRDFIKKINEVFHTFSNFQEHDLNIILAAQICNNIRFIYKSHNFYSQYILRKCNIKNILSFDTERSFKESTQNYEEIIYENLKKKFRQFISDLQGEDWLPDKPNKKPNMYVDGMIAYISTLYIALQTLSPIYIEFCFKEAIRFLPRLYFDEILFNSKVVKAYNIYSIENIKLDIDALEAYFNTLALTHPGFDESLLPIKNILSIFLLRKVDQIFDKSKQIDKFYDFKIESLCKFLLRYKNLKKSSEMKGKISESEMIGLVKKLKEHLQK